MCHSATRTILTVALIALAASPAVEAGRSSFVKDHGQGLQHGLISPKLDPGSDKVFFGHDYPDNLAPASQKRPEFGHPYPAIQDTADFDKDYVKDENGDDGEWHAQMEYDLLRTKAAKAKDDVQKAQAAEEEQRERLREAQAKRDEAAAAAGKAGAKVSETRAEATAAEKDIAAAEDAVHRAEDEDMEERHRAAEEEEERRSKEAAAAAGSDGVGAKAGEEHEGREDGAKDGAKNGANSETKNGKNGGSNDATKESGRGKDGATQVEVATATVKKEISDLKKCQEELEKAKARLKKVTESKSEYDKKMRELKEQNKARIEKEQAELSKEESEASKQSSDNEKEQAKLRGQEEEEKKQMSAWEEAHDVAARASQKESSSLADLEAKLKDAEKNLRKYRRKEDAGGGVAWQEKPEGSPGPKPCPPRSHAAPGCGISSAAIVSVLALALYVQ